MGKSTISMAIFNSYVSLPEGISVISGFAEDDVFYIFFLLIDPRYDFYGCPQTNPRTTVVHWAKWCRILSKFGL